MLSSIIYKAMPRDRKQFCIIDTDYVSHLQRKKKSPNIRTGSAPVTAKKLVTGKFKNILSYSVGNKHKKTIILIEQPQQLIMESGRCSDPPSNILSVIDSRATERFHTMSLCIIFEWD